MDLELVAADGRRYRVELGTNSVGRSPENDIVLDNESMSRRHAEVRWDGQQCQVVDLGSTNGTFVEGRQLAPYQPQPVAPGTRVRFGPTMTVHLAVRVAEAGPAARPSVPVPAPAPARGGGGSGPELLFRAVDVALDHRKLALGVLGLVAAGIVAALFLWLAGTLAEASGVLAVALGVIGVIALWLVLTYFSGAITRLAFLELGEGQRGEVRQALSYARRHLMGFFLSPLALLVVLVLTLGAEALLLLIGRVDYVGELVVSLVFLPLVLVNLGVLILAWFGTALSFPIMADRGVGVRDTLSQIWSLVRRMPGRLVAYMMLAGLISVVMFAFCFYLVLTALYTTTSLAAASMEPLKFAYVFSGLPLDMGDLLPGMSLGGLSFSSGDVPATVAIARILFGLSVAGLMALILVIPQLFFLSSACAVYLHLRQDLPASPGPGTPLAETWGAEVGSGRRA